jgi:transitional endoplasmic reticulum ATPase
MAAKSSRTLDKVEIVHHGEALVIPSSMTLESAAKAITFKIREEEQFTAFSAEINAFPYDGAYAMTKAMEKQFGITIAKAKMGWFGPEPPQSLTLEINADGETVQVPWGQFAIPAWENGTVGTGFSFSDGKLVFQMTADIKGKFKAEWEELVHRTRDIFLAESIYRGHAIRISVQESKMGSIPDIHFIKVNNAVQPIFSHDLEEQLNYDVLMYIRKADDVRKMHGGYIKRGVLFAGKYGTGKTMTANWIARVAEEHNWTFIYVKAPDIPYALDFARTYQPCVVFAEDIDAVAGSDRSQAVNDLLNKLDGVDSKRHDILFVATTNHVDSINAAMLRPGRMDVVMKVDPPDAEASIRMARHYAKGAMDPNDNYTAASQLLANRIPAEIEEVVKRAQTRTLFRTGIPNSPINAQDLYGAALAVKNEKDMLNARDIKPNPMKEFGQAVGEGLGGTLGVAITTIMQSKGMGDREQEQATQLVLDLADEGHRLSQAKPIDSPIDDADVQAGDVLIGNSNHTEK